jgi:hypothetical protein
MDTITPNLTITASTTAGAALSTVTAPTAAAPASTTDHAPSAPARPSLALVRRVVAKRSFATLATASSTGRSHAAGVLYGTVGDDVWVSTLRSSRKARNVAANPHVAITIPIRRIPLGPPSSVMFQGRAEIVALDDPDLRRLVAAGQLGSITGHGELELPGGCFVRITPNGRLHTYGLGMSLWSLLRNPLAAGGFVDLDPAADRSTPVAGATVAIGASGGTAAGANVVANAGTN